MEFNIETILGSNKEITEVPKASSVSISWYMGDYSIFYRIGLNSEEGGWWLE